MAMIPVQQTFTRYKPSLLKVVETMRTNVLSSDNETNAGKNQGNTVFLRTPLSVKQKVSDPMLMDKSSCIDFPKGGDQVMGGQGEQQACVSVFLSGKNTTKAAFTQKWVELINQSEKGKRVIASGEGGLAV